MQAHSLMMSLLPKGGKSRLIFLQSIEFKAAKINYLGSAPAEYVAISVHLPV